MSAQSPDRMLCPACDEEISVNARKCKHCGEWLDAEHLTPIQSEASAAARAVSKGIKQQKQDEGTFTLKVLATFIGLGFLAYLMQGVLGGLGYLIAFGVFVGLFLHMRKEYYQE